MYNTRSRKGNDVVNSSYNLFAFCFNPRSRKGNDASGLFCKLQYLVSIHVPARGTTLAQIWAAIDELFQSTFPQGERHYSLFAGIGNDNVSIHVPARGTTVPVPVCLCSLCRFNPRSRKGNDTSWGEKAFTQSVSIHVPARGTTILKMAKTIIFTMFQSTFPQGERLSRSVRRSVWIWVSIHVPARGTTCQIYMIYQISEFQSTFPQGERPRSHFLHPLSRVSIHVPARGTTGSP